MATEQDSTVINQEGDQKAGSLIEIVSPDGDLVLRQFTAVDAREIFYLIDRNREHLSQNGEDTAIKYPTFESVEASILNPSNPTRLRFAIRDRQEVYAGSINLTPDKDNPHRGEIGYYLGQEATGKGYTTRALVMLSDYAFNQLGYRELYCDIATTNAPSIKVAERVGYKETSRFMDEDKKQEIIVFSKTKPEEK